MQIKFSSIILIFVLFLMACASPEQEDADEADASEEAAAENLDTTIVLGDISDDPGEVIEGAQSLADYLANHLEDYGISEGRVRVAASTDEMIELLEAGEVDLYFDSVYPATLISDASGAEPILRRWRFGVEEYYTVIFVNEGGPIESIDDLPGHYIAMDNPFSTSGYVLPSVYLLENGFTLTGKESYNEELAEDEIGIVFSFDDENTLQWVVSGLVSAGATDNVSLSRLPEDLTENVVVLAETDPVPRQVVLVRPDIDPDLKEAVIEVLLNIDEDEEAQPALESFQTTQFDEFPGGITLAQNNMRVMAETVRQVPLPDLDS